MDRPLMITMAGFSAMYKIEMIIFQERDCQSEMLYCKA